MLFASLLGILFLIGFTFWLSVLVDCAMKESDRGNTKIVWVLIILFANLPGARYMFWSDGRSGWRNPCHHRSNRIACSHRAGLPPARKTAAIDHLTAPASASNSPPPDTFQS